MALHIVTYTHNDKFQHLPMQNRFGSISGDGRIDKREGVLANGKAVPVLRYYGNILLYYNNPETPQY